MKLFHEWILEYASKSKDKIALRDFSGEMSYGELEAKSAEISRQLSSVGVRQGDSIAVYVPYTKNIMLGALSALRMGCIYIPFDSAYPKKRLEYMLEDAGATAILSTHEFWERKKLDFPEEKVVFLDDHYQNADEKSVDCNNLTEDSPAMLLYTSGTTGKPKGVLHSKRMLIHIVDVIKAHDDAAMNENTRSGVMSSFPFVATQMFLLGPLIYGGTVCIAPEIARKDMDYLYQFIKEAEVTHVFLPSGLAAIMAEDYDLRGIFVFAAGEKLRNFNPCVPENQLINLYGSTETSAIISKKIRGNEERILVGKPYMNTKAMSVGSNMELLGPNEVGELLVSNDYMSSGYYHLPEVSAQKWLELDNRRWYRTGDRVMCNEEGDYDILGRIDNMIKLRGFRIETGEVEAQISNAVKRLNRTDVGQIVVVVKTIAGTDYLSCYYEAEEELDKAAVKKEIAEYLAEYMIPDIWVRMDALPRNLNGKVMRNELPQPKRERNFAAALESEAVARVLMTAAEVLKTDYFIGPDDCFTDLGGTSLNAMEFALALREQGIRISGSHILQYNSFRKITEAACISYEQFWSPEEYEEIQKDFLSRGEHIEKVLSISSWQDEMLFRQLLYPDSNIFQNVVFMQVDSILSESILREALDHISEENEELRSAIVFRNVSAIQQVITDRRIPLEIIEADFLNISILNKLRDTLQNESIDLQSDSMMKVVCLHVKEQSFLYVLTLDIAIGQRQLKRYMARLMQILEGYYPEDTSISGWREILDIRMDSDEEDEYERIYQPNVLSQREVTSDIRVFSENDGPKVIFVHTGNTGSDAYYRLANRIGEKVSFAVIEPYNLYHSDDIRKGIKKIAENYIRILKDYQPVGPYILGGWCYGGVVAQEMACQLKEAGEEVRNLIMLDSHALGNDNLREMSKGMLSEINEEYFETCPLFAELREAGMLGAMIKNADNVCYDLRHHNPSFYDGKVLYFKPDEIPSGVTGDSYEYWTKMMEFEAGNYENYCNKEKLHIVHTPHEHDLMMDDPSLDIIVPELYREIGIK